MVAFEILVNGKKLYTIGAGDFGILSALVHWDRIHNKTGRVYERACVRGNAMHGSDKTHSVWPDENLKVGDEVTVRIIETDNCDPAVSRQTLNEMKKSIDERPTNFAGPV